MQRPEATEGTSLAPCIPGRAQLLAQRSVRLSSTPGSWSSTSQPISPLHRSSSGTPRATRASCGAATGRCSGTRQTSGSAARSGITAAPTSGTSSRPTSSRRATTPSTRTSPRSGTCALPGRQPPSWGSRRTPIGRRPPVRCPSSSTRRQTSTRSMMATPAGGSSRRTSSSSGSPFSWTCPGQSGRRTSSIMPRALMRTAQP
mmetsp:Transcript_79783/g.252204  ORF Transcript_79783/g.252204 Transcript_79783/m.252204 type:complete len:202 (+) Transcript_79783:317-922(+)